VAVKRYPRPDFEIEETLALGTCWTFSKTDAAIDFVGNGPYWILALAMYLNGFAVLLEELFKDFLLLVVFDIIFRLPFSGFGDITLIFIFITV
jgi:hypothetical protein